MVPVEVQGNRRRIGQLVGAKARRNARVVEAAVPTAFSPQSLGTRDFASYPLVSNGSFRSRLALTAARRVIA